MFASKFRSEACVQLSRNINSLRNKQEENGDTTLLLAQGRWVRQACSEVSVAKRNIRTTVLLIPTFSCLSSVLTDTGRLERAVFPLDVTGSSAAVKMQQGNRRITAALYSVLHIQSVFDSKPLELTLRLKQARDVPESAGY
jgi:hypothetical protein